MLLTMEEYYKEEFQEMPHPERIDKVRNLPGNFTKTRPCNIWIFLKL